MRWRAELVNKDSDMFQLPIVNIDQLAKDLNLSRDWINRRWLRSENPPPSFRDGDNVFFEIEELQQWAKRRSLGFDFTDTEDDLLD